MCPRYYVPSPAFRTCLHPPGYGTAAASLSHSMAILSWMWPQRTHQSTSTCRQRRHHHHLRPRHRRHRRHRRGRHLTPLRSHRLHRCRRLLGRFASRCLPHQSLHLLQILRSCRQLAMRLEAAANSSRMTTATQHRPPCRPQHRRRSRLGSRRRSRHHRLRHHRLRRHRLRRHRLRRHRLRRQCRGLCRHPVPHQ